VAGRREVGSPETGEALRGTVEGMHNLPHRYGVQADASDTGTVRLASAGLADLETAPPVAFGGPGDRWSPETLLVGAVADCFVLSFRAIARASSVGWSALHVEAEGVLDRVDGVTRFTEIRLRARLTLASGADPSKAQRALEKAERSCMISRSLVAPVRLEAEIVGA
jgi:peroxiredoxin-like protein